jgi:hypothetical protein
VSDLLLPRTDAGVVDHADEDPPVGWEVVPDDRQDAFAVGLTGHLDVEGPRPELKEVREQFGVVDVRAMGGALVTSGAGVDPDPECAPPR